MRRVAYQTVARMKGAAEPLLFGGPGRSRDHQVSLFFCEQKRERRGEADAEADMPLAEASGAICVQRFDGSHYLQFTLRIAFRCVLHRYGNQDIRC